ncbi:hypothetical protein [Geoalkalibacter halelectricus]|uniref:hypothetical protein n=1 Tax=Geoalkalibacter halelectricus TaxID=2847045 RepID=UPI003D26319D
MIFRNFVFFFFLGLCSQTFAATWTELPNSNLRPHAWDWSPHPTPGVFASIMGAWSGGTMDTDKNRLLIFGGGHADYGGQEIYAFDLRTHAWSLVAEPENYEDLDVTCSLGGNVTVNGFPKSVHSYDRNVYFPERKSFCFTTGSIGYPTCDMAYRELACYSFETKKWSFETAGIRTRHGGGAGATASRHQLTGEWWYQGTGSSTTARLGRFQPKTNVWEYGGYCNFMASTHNKVSAIDPHKSKLVIIDHAGRVYILDLDEFVPGTTRMQNHRVVTKGDIEILNSSDRMGLAYDMKHRKMVGWAGGKVIYILDLDSLEWIKKKTVGDHPGPPLSNGTFGRFAYSEESQVFVLANGVDSNIFLLSLDGLDIGGSPGD